MSRISRRSLLATTGMGILSGGLRRALDAERPSVPGLCDRADQLGDIVVAAAERLNQRAPIPALPVRSVYRDPVQAWNGLIQ